jgi:hypothetical protein
MCTRPERGARPPVRLIPYSARTASAPAPPPADARTPPARPSPARPPLRAVPAAEDDPEDDLAAAARATARVFAEVIAGIRPVHHLAGRATPEVYDRLGRTLPMARPAGRHASRSLRVVVPLVQVPLPGVAEVSAVVFIGGYAQALAMRLERLRGRWRCAAVETTLSPRQLRELHDRRPGTAA